jgi:hypothetical protein
MAKMKVNQFYCVSSRKRVTVPHKDIKFKMIKNPKRKGGVPALTAVNPKCGTKLFKFVSLKDAPKLKAKYGR